MAIEKIEGCIGCEMCIEACPVDVIRFDKDSNRAVVKYPEDCQVCNLCVVYCPVGAIKITNDKCTRVMTSW